MKNLVLQGIKYCAQVSILAAVPFYACVLYTWYDLETKSMRKVLLLSIFCTKHGWKFNVVLQVTCSRDHVGALCVWMKCWPPSPGYCTAALARKGRRSGPLQLPGRLGMQTPGQENSRRRCLPPDKPIGECTHSPARPLSSLLTSWTDSPALILLLLPNTHFQGISHFPSQKFPKEPELESSAMAHGTQHVKVFWLEWWHNFLISWRKICFFNWKQKLNQGWED